MVVTDRVPVLEGWEDLAEREERSGIHPGDPILLSPDYRIDEVLSLYLCRSSFARLEPETKRNYANDYCVFFDFLWARGKNWSMATADDLWDFEDWRTRSPRNPRRVGGARWNRGLAALTRLYGWAADRGFIVVNPIAMRPALNRYGELVSVPEARAKHAKTSNVRRLTPRAFRLWVNVGLRRRTAEGRPHPQWVGRLEDRNAAFADLLLSSGMRLTEAASLLTFEVPSTRLDGGRYYCGRLARVVTKSKKARTFYASAVVVGDVEGYVESSRAEAVRRAQARGRYELLSEWRMITHRSGRLRPMLHWCDQDGVVGQTPLGEATVAERMTYFILARAEAVALAVLLVLDHGLNSVTVAELPVPRATPDSGEGSAPVYRIELEKRRRGDELRLLTYMLINHSVPDSYLVGRRPSWRTRQSARAIYGTFRTWADFSNWAEKQGISSLAACSPALFRNYSDYLIGERGLARNTVQHHLIALTRLWIFDGISSRPLGICEPPWSSEGIDDYLPAAAAGGENVTEPISPDTMGPLLIWALRVVDDFAPDILAAWEHNRRLHARARQAVGTPATLAALHDYLAGLVARGEPLPTKRLAGQPAVASYYIAGLTGASPMQISNQCQLPKWRRYRDQNPGPCPLPTPIRGRIDGRPWTEAIDYHEATGLMRHLGTACFIVLSYLTGQRPGETLGLRTGCCPDPGDGRPLIYGHTFKTARDEEGNHLSQGQMRGVPWVAIPPARNAIQVLEQVVPADSLLFGATAHDYPAHRPLKGALTRSTMFDRVEAFAAWASDLAIRTGRPEEVVPDDPHGAIGTERFRRALAWHIARRPGGLVALAVQYGHMRTAISGNYASRSRDGIHDLLDIETARATADTFVTLHDDLGAGVGLSGPAARRAIHAAAQAPAFPGSIRTARQAEAILHNRSLSVHDNPHAYLMCVYNPDKALCHRLGLGDTPTLNRCVPTCTNIARTDHHAEQLTTQADGLEKNAASELTPEPLRDRLRGRAATLRDLAEQHYRTRLTSQETSS
ncbi:hypothetical protein [Kitasatospora sp. NPDC087314]|uniref:hypothetical protein n=1 Tax=Kitasatospora sp. NPDC087314 TaxID=3364068 RepID=UPI00381A00D4